MEEPLNLALNLMGTFAFGLSGGILAVKKRMDLFGVLVLSVSTGLGGGIVRDLILGHTPPATLTDWRYLGAAGLLGMVTGVGGGVLRDIMAAEVPLIFRSEIYAVASLLGAIIIIIATQIGFSGVPAEILAAIATFTLRMVSLRRGWRIPIAMPKSTDKG